MKHFYPHQATIRRTPSVLQQAVERQHSEPPLTDDERAETTGAIRVTFHPSSVVLALSGILLALLAMATIPPVVAAHAGVSLDRAVFRIFAFGEEANIPTLFSTGLLALAAFLLVSIGREADNRGAAPATLRRWYGLAAIFAFLAVDEAAMIHETLNYYPLGITGMLAVVDTVPWVWFYATLAVAVAVIYLPFLLRLPHATAATFVVAGGIYVTGSIGFEILAAHLRQSGILAPASLPPVVLGIAQEFCEMFGSLLFVAALLHYRAFLGAEPPRQPETEAQWHRHPSATVWAPAYGFNGPGSSSGASPAASPSRAAAAGRARAHASGRARSGSKTPAMASATRVHE